MSVDATAAAVVSATLAFVISQTWKCLCVPATGKNGIFDKVFFDEEMLMEVATAAKLTFCPGLLDAVRSPTPPDISFFKKTPSKYLGLWGVYNLVLEKPGCVPLVYIGEASEKYHGIKTRWKVYNNPNTPSNRKLLPSKVKDALDDGFKITHKGVLAHCSIPGAKNVPRFRLLHYSVEAMFSFLFWAMFPKTGDYQIGSCCPWPRESFTYGGLCSHSSLNDPMRANIGLSPEELEELAADAAERKRLAHNRANQEAREREKACDPEAYRQKNNERYRTRKAENPLPFIESSRRARARVKADPVLHDEHKTKERTAYPSKRAAIMASKKYYCEICNKACGKPGELANHLKTEKHRKRVEWAAVRKDDLHHCEPCDVYFENAKILRSHMKSDAHFRVVNNRPKAADKDMTDVAEEPQDLFCDICDRLCVNLAELQWHNQSDNHKRRAAKVADGVEFSHRCDVCDRGFETAEILRAHQMGKKHKDRVAELEEDSD